jgi:hypothetical protein
MPAGENYRESQNRPVTGEEALLIRWLLEHGDDKAQPFIPQVNSLVVISKCTCGCPTVDFQTSARSEARLLCHVLGEVDGQRVGVLLFQADGELSCLEIHAMAGTDRPFGLPKIESLYLWEELRNHPNPAE